VSPPWSAKLSYGAFEYTVGTAFPVPDPERVRAAIAAAGHGGSGHVPVAGGDPVVALGDWEARIEAVHVKDVHGFGGWKVVTTRRPHEPQAASMHFPTAV
jgi:hypothetical protein